MTTIHVTNRAGNTFAICGAIYDVAVTSWTERINETTCVECRRLCGLSNEGDEDEAGTEPEPKARTVCRYTARLYTASPLNDKEREYLESHIDAWLASRVGGECDVPQGYENVDAEFYGKEHLLGGDDE